jgi:hypothetical protein
MERNLSYALQDTNQIERTYDRLPGANRDYYYPKLQDATQQIRLLQFLPSQEPEEIVLQMTVHDLESVEGKFVAISYVWGDANDLVTITINYRPFLMTRNGVRALRRVRRHDPEGVFWMDAACVNQTDTQERGAQVQNMGRIYSYAALVAAFLGPGKHLRRIMSSSTASTATNSEVRKQYHDLFSLAGLAYFSRMWIVQEVLLARELWLLSGEDAYEGKSVYSMSMKIFQRMNARRGHNEVLLAGLARPLTLLRDKYDGDFNSDAALRGAVSLPKIVARYAGGACKDPRDQIYSLVGLASRDSGYPIHYDATVASVIWELAIRSPGKIDLQEAARLFYNLIKIMFPEPDADNVASGAEREFEYWGCGLEDNFLYTYDESDRGMTSGWGDHIFVDLPSQRKPAVG